MLSGLRHRILRLKCLVMYSAVHGFWSVEELADPVTEPTGCGEVARGGCYFLGTSARQSQLY
jgi:hypothetical protein